MGRKIIRKSEQEENIFNFTAGIFNEESPKLIGQTKMDKKYKELCHKSLFMGMGIAVNFVVQIGDELTMSDRMALSQGKISEGYAEYGFRSLLENLPKLKKNGDEYNFCFCWFYAGIGVAVAFLERELNKYY